MKHLYTLLFVFVLICGDMHAQQPIVVSQDSLRFAGNNMPGFRVIIPEADYDKTVKNWKKLLQSGTKSKIVEKNNEMTIFGARIKKVSDNPVNVYSIINDRKGSVELQAAMELEKDKFISESEAKKAKEFLFDFSRDQYIDVVTAQLNDEKSKLRSLESDLNSLQREQSRMEKSSKDNTKLITEEQERLRNLNNELDYLTAEPRTGEAATGMGVTDPDTKKDAEKNEKKLNREIKSTEKKINKAESEIDDNKREIPRNAEAQEEARNKVTEQQTIVNSLEDKLETIKKYKL
ncbi:MAG TPA: hypothetical protein VK213_04510 [Bacteroidales bacterium]|nr:hypothetical protein [Bacteroidales bacterium]